MSESFKKNLSFSEAFFLPEEREGFLVSSGMKKCWASELEVLSDVDALCKKHGIKWFAYHGTLLGAIRHKGFIPWDDDIDIAMTRENYERFLQVAGQLPEIYEIYNSRRDINVNYRLWTVVENGKQIRFDDAFLYKYHGFPYVSGIDIFVLDHVPPKQEATVISVLLGALEKIERAYVADDKLRPWENPELRELLLLLEQNLNRSFPQDDTLRLELLRIHDMMMRMYEDMETPYTDMFLFQNDPEYLYEECDFDELVEVPFENMSIYVPADYSEILKKRYGNWEKRVKEFAGHDYPIYKNQEDQVFRKYGFRPEI